MILVGEGVDELVGVHGEPLLDSSGLSVFHLGKKKAEEAGMASLPKEVDFSNETESLPPSVFILAAIGARAQRQASGASPSRRCCDADDAVSAGSSPHCGKELGRLVAM